MREDGYLFLRSLAPREDLLALRRAILEICATAGWPKAMANGPGPGHLPRRSAYMAVYRR